MPHPHYYTSLNLISAMHDPTYPITGIRAGWGDSIDREWGPKQRVPVRVEADDFFLNDEYAMQRDLLYHAMVEFKKISYADKLSYFQVAGEFFLVLLLFLHESLTIRTKVFMVSPMFLGTPPEAMHLNTVNIQPSNSVAGIARTWSCLRCAPMTPLEINPCLNVLSSNVSTRS